MQKKNPTLTLTLLISIFFLPMLAAWLTYSKGVLLPNHKVNHGTLITPPFQLAQLTLSQSSFPEYPSLLKGKWAFLYLTDEPQNQLSQKSLYYMRQIRQATGKDRERIERTILTVSTNKITDDWLKANFPGTHHFIISQEKIQLLKAKLPKKLDLEKGSLYLVDPLGNIMLFYAPNASPKGILKDLQRVLKVSQIG